MRGAEVVAVYVEERIRTYGIEVCTGLTLVRRALVDPSSPASTPNLATPPVAPSLVLSLALAHSNGALTLEMLLGNTAPVDPTAWAEAPWLPGEGPLLSWKHPVEALWFHGPHFGDRHGIAAAALGALYRGQVPVLSACFAGASVFLVLPAGQGDPARAWLSAQFVQPTKEERRP